MKFSIVSSRKIWYAISGALVVLGVIAMSVWGFKMGIDFTGGALLEVDFTENRPETAQVRESIQELDYITTTVVQPVDETGMMIRMPFISAPQHDEVLELLDGMNGEAELTELRYETIGPSISAELKKKSIWSIIIVIIAIILYIAWSFRKVSESVSSWKYGLAAIIALVHDVVLPAGVFAILGRFAGFQIDTLFVVALLTILGFSVNDTIVTFDRIRENLLRERKLNFKQTVDLSIKQTISRSINTSITTLSAMIAIYLFGGETVKDFMLTLIIGMLAGTYSSIFLAAPLLVDFQKLSKK